MGNKVRSLSIPKELSDRIDKERDLVSFSAYVTNVLKEYVGTLDISKIEEFPNEN